MPGFGDNFLKLGLPQFLGFEMFTRGGASLEAWMLPQPALWVASGSHSRRLVLGPEPLRDTRAAGEVEEGVTFESFRPRRWNGWIYRVAEMHQERWFAAILNLLKVTLFQ